MKFRCERDVLVEALGSAGRAVSTRGGAMPVLSGIRAQLAGNALQLTGSDTDLTIEVAITVNGEGDGVVVLPGKLAGEIVRALPAGAVVVDIDEGRGHHHLGPRRVHDSHPSGGGVSAAARANG